MRQSLAALLVALPALAVAGCDVEAMGPQSRQHVSEPRRLDKGGTFTLQNTNGAVEVEAWDRDSISIEAEKVGPEGRLDEIQIEIKGEGSRVDVSTRFPHVTFGSNGHVDYRVKVPASAHVELETTNGRLRASGTQASLRAETTNGGVEIGDAAGSVEASTTNGSIRVTFRDAPETGAQRFETTNGSITLTLPADVSGEFEARTVNGGISTDFPLDVSGRHGKHLQGHVGTGGPRYDLSTTNGGIRILKGA